MGEMTRMGMTGAGPGRRGRATIEDVAKLAGVSRQTVSRAVNDMAEITPSTKQRVLDAVRTLGYRPSRFARGLVKQDTTTIGLIVSDLVNPFFPEVAAGVLAAARSEEHTSELQSRQYLVCRLL